MHSRFVMKSIVALVVAGLLAAGCGGDEQRDAARKRQGQQQAARPKKGGGGKKNEVTFEYREGVVRAGYVASTSAAAMFHCLVAGGLGFEIDAKRYKSSGHLGDALERGEVGVALICGVPQVLSAAAKNPGDIEILALFESTPCLLVPRGAADDATFADYLNENAGSIGCFPGATFPYYTRLVLDGLGVNVNRVGIVPVKADLQKERLESGDLHALFTLEPVGVGCTVDGIADYIMKDTNLLARFVIETGGDGYFPGGCLAVNRSAVDDIEKVRGGLLECLASGVLEAKTSSPITIAALKNYADLNLRYAEVLPVSRVRMGDELRSDEMAKMVEILKKLDQVPRKLDADAVFYVAGDGGAQ